MLTTGMRAELAAELARAELDRVAVSPIVDRYPGIDVVDAYEVQLLNIRRRLDGGAKVVGHKVGLSSKAMQQMMGVDEPDYGHLLADMEVFEDLPVDTSKFLLPRVEVEVGFVLGADLPGEDCTEADVLAATVAYAPSIELIDSRITDWKIGLADTISDNAANAGIVTGGRPVKPDAVDLRWVGALLYKNGVIEETGLAAGVLNHPATGVAWLANKLAPWDEFLEKGEVVLGGSFTRPTAAVAGDCFHADYGPLGSIAFRFV